MQHCIAWDHTLPNTLPAVLGRKRASAACQGLRGRLVWKQHLVCCLPSATISDKHCPCHGLIVLVLQRDPTENACGHTTAPKTWRSVAFCVISPANLKARGLQMLPVPKLLLCLNYSHLSRAMLSPQSIHSSKRIICRCFLPVREIWWAGHPLNGFETWDAWLCQE